MNIFRNRVRASLVLALGITPLLHGAEVESELVELPPLEIVAAERARPWYYGRIPDAEILSRCTDSETEAFIHTRHRLKELLKMVLPDDLHAKYDVPEVIILSDSRSTPTSAKEIISGFSADDPKKSPDAQRDDRSPKPRRPNVRILPNVRLSDLDASAVFAIFDRVKFQPDKLTLTDYHVALLLGRRTPELPDWLVAGFVRVFGDMQFPQGHIALVHADWISDDETENLRREKDYPRTLLPMRTLFEMSRAQIATTREAELVWRFQSALLVRWALAGDAARREGFWNLVRRGSLEALNETIVREHLGLGYSDLRDQLSDYLSEAVAEGFQLPVGKIPPPPSVRMHRATQGEIARLKGTWEQFAAAEVKRKHPAFVARYANQARETLAKGLESGTRDPHLLAIAGLLERDVGNEALAELHLEEAARSGLVRPRVYYELARLRYAKAITQPDEPNRLSERQFNLVRAPLEMAWKHEPAFAETYMLALDMWSHPNAVITPTEWDRADEALRLFPRSAALHFFAAKLHFVHGSTARATELLDRADRLHVPVPLRPRLQELRRWLATAEK